MYQPMQSNLTLKVLWRSLIKQLVLREPFVWDLQSLRNNRIPSNSLPHSTKMFLRALLSSLWNYFCKRWSLRLPHGKRKLSPEMSVQFQPQLRVQMCVESQTCRGVQDLPLPQLGITKEKGSKVMSSPGPQIQETRSKVYSSQTMRKASWSPVCYSTTRTGEICIVNLLINLMYPYLYLLKAPAYTMMNVTHSKQKQGCSQEVNSDYMFYLQGILPFSSMEPNFRP